MLAVSINFAAATTGYSLLVGSNGPGYVGHWKLVRTAFWMMDILDLYMLDGDICLGLYSPLDRDWIVME